MNEPSSSSSVDVEADWNNCLGVVQCGNLPLIKQLKAQLAGMVPGLVRNDVELRGEITRLNGVIREYATNLANQDREVERLQSQLAEISKHDVCTERLITTLRERDEARAQLAAQTAVVERAAAALERFAKHTERCGRFTTISGECSCGRDDAMRPAILAAIDIRRARLDAADVPANSTGENE